VLPPQADHDFAGSVEQLHSHVVVLDATASPLRAAQEVEVLTVRCPWVGIVAIGDEPTGALGRVPVLPKWGGFGPLLGAIEHAAGAGGGPLDVPA
jgi:hypothetical protein